MRRFVGKASLAFVRRWARLRDKVFSTAVSGAFAEFGPRSVICLPARLNGVGRISVGAGVFLGPGCWLQTLAAGGGAPVLEIGSGTSVAGNCVLSAALEIRLGERVLLARNVYVADHVHAFEDTTRAVLDQGIRGEAPVSIGAGAWLGQNVVVGPGVTIGRGAVIGAGSVVKESVPPYCLAVGAPARVVRSFGPKGE